MKRLVGFEFRNMLTQLTVVAVIALILISTVFNFTAFFNSEPAVTGSGEQVQGIASYMAVENESGDIKGTLNQAYLDRLFDSYYQSIEKSSLENDIWNNLTKYTYSNYIINFAKYGKSFNNTNLDLGEKISENEFYQQYKNAMSEVIESHNQYNWLPLTTEHMKEINKKIDSMEIPFNVDYYSGLSLFKWQFGKQFLFVLIVLAFTLCPIFSKDTKNGISELTLSSKFGRRKNMNARVIVGNLFAIALYSIFVITLLVEIGVVASFRGWGQSIQNLWYTCVYNLSIGDGILIMILSGLLTVLIIANLIMLISIIIVYSKVSTLISLLAIFLLTSSLFSNNTLLGQLNPVSLATNFSAGIPNAFEIFYFLGSIVIPYVLFFAIIAIVYLAVIRFVTVRQYKKYKLN